MAFSNKLCLKIKGAFSVANGSKAKPESGTADVEKWEKEDEIAMFTITAAVETKQITLIKTYMTSYKVLTKLDSVFQQKSILIKYCYLINSIT